tara:strand:- start:357 stop:770 length:414 start_codon:yes stop_codon:yes gene_type:complete
MFQFYRIIFKIELILYIFSLLKHLKMTEKTCAICLEDYPSKQVSHCLNCLESGNTCHECEKKWLEAGNNTLVCSVCKQETKKNVKHIIVETPAPQEQPRNNEIDWVLCKLKIVIIVLFILLCLFILLGISYCVNEFS